MRRLNLTSIMDAEHCNDMKTNGDLLFYLATPMDVSGGKLGIVLPTVGHDWRKFP